MWGALKVRDAATGEIRRVGVSVDEAKDASFSALLTRVAALFPSCSGSSALPGAYSLCWTDSDGDSITVSSDAELREALDVASLSATRPGAAMVRFTLEHSTSPSETAAAELPVLRNYDHNHTVVAAAAAATAAKKAEQERVFQAKLRARLEKNVAVAKNQRSTLQIASQRVIEQRELLKLAREEQSQTLASLYEDGENSQIVTAVQGSAFRIGDKNPNLNTFIMHPGGKVTFNAEEGRWFATAHDAIAIRIPGLSDNLTLATFEPGFSTMHIVIEDSAESLRLVEAQRVKDYVFEDSPQEEDGEKDTDFDLDICPEDTPSKVIRIRVPKNLSSCVDGIDLLSPNGILFPGAGLFRKSCSRGKNIPPNYPCRRGDRRCRGPGFWNRSPIHFGIVCDGSEMSPIIGTRYHKIGQDFDLCEAEFQKLPEEEKVKFEVIFTHGSSPVPYGSPVHFGVECDISGMNPIHGIRFHLIGANYDVCEAEFNKFPDEEKKKYEVIIRRGAEPLPYDKWLKSNASVPNADSSSEEKCEIYPDIEKEWVAVDANKNINPQDRCDDNSKAECNENHGEAHKPNKWDSQVKFLASIGFTQCEDYLIDLLVKRQGDVNAVINDICNNES